MGAFSVRFEIDLSQVEDLAARMDAVPTAIQVEVEEALRICGKLIKADAQFDAPYRTGFLRSTIYAAVKLWTLIVGAWAHYAGFQEFGTRYFRGRFFLSKAIQRRMPKIYALIHKAVVYAISEELP